MHYTHLNIKSHYTLLNSLLKVDTIIDLCTQNNFSAVSVCDVNSTFGLSELYYKCKDIKPLLGVELVFNSDNIILYAKNYSGLEAIYYLTSLVNSNKLQLDDIYKFASDLVCIITKKSSAYLEYSNSGKSQIIKEMRFQFKDVYFIDDTFDTDVIKYCLDTKTKPVYAPLINYSNYNDKKYFDLLCAIKNNEMYIRDNNGKRSYFLSYSEVSQVATEAMLSNVKEIIDTCNVVIPNDMLIPKYNSEFDSDSYLLSLCKKGLEKRIGCLDEKYVSRLKYELSVICKMGFSDYFLIVYDYVKFAKNSDVAVGAGRGSAASSLVAFVLGITEVDPIKYNLLFERFLNPERLSLPDIDVDFEDVRRDEVVNYLILKYGKNNVGAISTFSTFTSKQVLRDCAKAFGMNSVEIKYLTSSINPNFTLKQNYSFSAEFRENIDKEVNNEMIYQYALKLEGLNRHNSLHAAGVVISSDSLLKKIGVLANERVNALCATMDNLEKMGLIKMDLLGLRNLSILKSILNEIEKQHGVYIDIYSIDLEDSKVLQLFSTGNTSGIFQFESMGMQALLRKLKPGRFMDLVIANALHRPGPMEYIDEFVARAHGKRFSYVHDSLEYILSETYGIIVFQEQIMQVAKEVASFSYAQADILRSAMSKKDEKKLISQKQMFLDGCVANGYGLEVATKIFDDILKFANYGFNKAHAVSYSLIGYTLGYLKCYYPNIFNVALMNNSISNHKKIFHYINECRVSGIKIVGIDVNKSKDWFFLDTSMIVMPLTLVKGVNKVVCESIIKERVNGLFTSFHNFVVRMAKYDIKQSVIENLVFANAFDCLNEEHNKKSQIHSIEGILDMFAFDSDISIVGEEFVYTKLDEYTTQELVNFERDVLGFNFSLHPTSIYTDKMQVTSLNMKEYVNHNVQMILYVENVRKIKTKNGDDMAFVSCSDIYGIIETVCFPRFMQKYNVEKGSVIYAYGKVEYRNDKCQLIMENIKVRSD